MKQSRMLALAMTGVIAALSGCTDFKAHTYQGSQVMEPMHVKYGVVLEIRDVDIQKKHGIEVTYRLDNGDVKTLVQEKDEANPIAVGDHIRILEGSFSARAVKAAG